MVDPELQHYLSRINQHLTEIKNQKRPGVWRSFFNGMFGAFGYLVGIVLVILVVGWFLNKTGLLGPFQTEWQKFQNFMSQAEATMSNSQTQQGSAQKGQIYTLPNGQKVQVVQ